MDGKDANSIHKQVTVLLLSQVAIFNSLHLWQELRPWTTCQQVLKTGLQTSTTVLHKH